MRRYLPRFLMIAGALLLLKGGLAVYPFLFPVLSAEIAELPRVDGMKRVAPGDPVFQLSIPRHKARFTVVEGTTTTALREGPGHLEGSALPGQTGNIVIAGHRDTHFLALKDVLIGDEIRIASEGAEYVYRVVDVRVVSPRDTSVLRPQARDSLTLITCYPFRFMGPAPDRYVVRALLFDR
ncbi:MAG TPA: class D sortase [Terriglobia bacterium]|nr:class D sortase [Terriglobia bacterium]